MSWGADDYIEKPVDPQILAAKIRAVYSVHPICIGENRILLRCGLERAQHRAFVDGNLMELKWEGIRAVDTAGIQRWEDLAQGIYFRKHMGHGQLQ